MLGLLKHLSQRLASMVNNYKILFLSIFHHIIPYCSLIQSRSCNKFYTVRHKYLKNVEPPLSSSPLCSSAPIQCHERTSHPMRCLNMRSRNKLSSFPHVQVLGCLLIKYIHKNYHKVYQPTFMAES